MTEQPIKVSKVNIEAEEQKRIKRKAYIGTAGIYALLLILFLITGLKKPYPPYQPMGIDIVFGHDATGFEGLEPHDMNDAEETGAEQSEQLAEASAATDLAENQTETPVYDIQNAPELGDKKEEKSEKETDLKIDPDKSDKPKEAEEEKEEKREVDPNQLFPGGGTSKGDEQLDGDKGDIEGRDDIASLEKHGKSDLYGEDISFDLAGRSIAQYPGISANFTRNHVIVINIRVDRQGNVTHARVDIRRSTTTDPYLVQIAEQAARDTKFSAAPSATAEQNGSITFRFRLQ